MAAQAALYIKNIGDKGQIVARCDWGVIMKNIQPPLFSHIGTEAEIQLYR